jgi:magnesium-transporting ATPase (P-type)
LCPLFLSEIVESYDFIPSFSQGLVVLENRLKPDSAAVIDQLIEANIKTLMVTGDNLLTAISVARDCGMVGAKDQVVIVSCDEAIKSATDDKCTKPQLIYTLADYSILRSSTRKTSVTIDFFPV